MQGILLLLLVMTVWTIGALITISVVFGGIELMISLYRRLRKHYAPKEYR